MTMRGKETAEGISRASIWAAHLSIELYGSQLSPVRTSVIKTNLEKVQEIPAVVSFFFNPSKSKGSFIWNDSSSMAQFYALHYISLMNNCASGERQEEEENIFFFFLETPTQREREHALLLELSLSTIDLDESAGHASAQQHRQSLSASRFCSVLSKTREGGYNEAH